MAPLLPAEQAWLVTLTAPPAAGGAMDEQHVYVPLQDVVTVVEGQNVVTPDSASIVALDRETGLVRWTRPIASVVPPAVGGGLVFVAAADALHALDGGTGVTTWSLPLDTPIRGAMLLHGPLLLAPAGADELIAVRVDTQQIAWRQPVGDTASLAMTADDAAVYTTTSAGRVACLRLADGSLVWERVLEGMLGEPAIGEDRLLVGSTTNSLWALDPESGRDKWVWRRLIFGGDVIGADLEEDVAYVTSSDNIVRALDRSSGAQLWKADITTRPVRPPRVFPGTVAVIGLPPTVLSTFDAKTGSAVSTWAVPSDAVLLGAPLIDERLKPYAVAIAVIMRDGRAAGVRPTGMSFPEPKSAPLTILPGRTVPREAPPGTPDTAPR